MLATAVTSDGCPPMPAAKKDPFVPWPAWSVRASKP
jgi:hypothetical protein